MKFCLVVFTTFLCLAGMAAEPKFTFTVTQVPVDELALASLDWDDGATPSKLPKVTPRPGIEGGARPPAGQTRPTRPWPPKRPGSVIGQFILVGEKIWSIVHEGRPLVSVSNASSLDVLPNIGADGVSAMDMTSWSLPQVKGFRVRMKNTWGVTVFDLEYRIFYSFGGTYDGKGSYLAGVTIEPTHVHVKWGFNVDVNVEVVSITNVGTLEDPVPALTLQLHYNVSSLMSNSTNRDTYTIVGDGRLIEYD